MQFSRTSSRTRLFILIASLTCILPSHAIFGDAVRSWFDHLHLTDSKPSPSTLKSHAFVSKEKEEEEEGGVEEDEEHDDGDVADQEDDDDANMNKQKHVMQDSKDAGSEDQEEVAESASDRDTDNRESDIDDAKDDNREMEANEASDTESDEETGQSTAGFDETPAHIETTQNKQEDGDRDMEAEEASDTKSGDEETEQSTAGFDETPAHVEAAQNKQEELTDSAAEDAASEDEEDDATPNAEAQEPSASTEEREGAKSVFTQSAKTLAEIAKPAAVAAPLQEPSAASEHRVSTKPVKAVTALVQESSQQSASSKMMTNIIAPGVDPVAFLAETESSEQSAESAEAAAVAAEAATYKATEHLRHALILKQAAVAKRAEMQGKGVSSGEDMEIASASLTIAQRRYQREAAKSTAAMALAREAREKALRVSSNVFHDLKVDSSRSTVLKTFGPGSCVSTWRDEASGHCFLKTDCSAQASAFAEYDIGFQCLESDQKKEEHRYGRGAFSLVETQDMGVACKECHPLSDSPASKLLALQQELQGLQQETSELTSSSKELKGLQQELSQLTSSSVNLKEKASQVLRGTANGKAGK